MDPKRIGTYLGLETPPALFTCLPRNDIHAFIALVNRERYDRIAVACCGPVELFREAVAALALLGTSLALALSLGIHSILIHIRL